MKRLFAAIGGTATAIWALVSAFMAAAPWAALIKRRFEIELHGLPAAAYEAYCKIRDPFFDLLLAWMPFPLPILVKDLVVVYLLIGAMNSLVWINGEKWLTGSSGRMPFWKLLVYKARLIFMWPKSIRLFFVTIKKHGFFGKVPDRHYAHIVRAMFWLFICSSVVCAAFVFSAFAWSHIQEEVLK